MDFLNSSPLLWLIIAGAAVILLRIFLKVAKAILNFGMVVIALAIVYVIITGYIAPLLLP